ncbi:type II CAAX prenyl endopeptidase Rce1 family protein [Chloroflexota bacterium]
MTYTNLHSIVMARTHQVAAQGMIRPMPLWLSAILFIIPSLFFMMSSHLVMPWLDIFGLAQFESVVVAFTIPHAGLFAAALIAYHRVEKLPLRWSAFAERFRLPRLTFKIVLLGLGIFVVGAVASQLLAQVGLLLITNGIIPIPSNLPLLLDPNIQISLPVLERFVGGPILGSWNVAIAFFVMLFFNITGEELWWRGYILPRQQLVHGRWTWLIHGLMWWGFHSFVWWNNAICDE